MDGRNFDDLTRKLATGTSRRSVLRGLLGGAAALGGMKAAGVSAQRAPKRMICHFTHSAGNPYVIIEVSENSIQEQSHLSHGDTYYNNCCIDSDCNDGYACTTDTCVNGSCVYTPNDAYCDDGNVCTDDYCRPAESSDSSGCVYVNNTAPCTDDGDPCTNDVCANGVCTHPDNGTCEEGNCPDDGSCKWDVSEIGDGGNGSRCCVNDDCGSRCCVVSQGNGCPFVCGDGGQGRACSPV
jgi:hypothetical protein